MGHIHKTLQGLSTEDRARINESIGRIADALELPDHPEGGLMVEAPTRVEAAMVQDTIIALALMHADPGNIAVTAWELLADLAVSYDLHASDQGNAPRDGVRYAGPPASQARH
jgi:hypothetical protein